MACACAGPCGCGFTKLTPEELGKTLAQRLIPKVDRARDINTRIGVRPYVIRQVRTRWSGGKRGRGQESVHRTDDLLPTPRIGGIASVGEVVKAIGSEEEGTILVTEVSGRYTEDMLRGIDPQGNGPSPDENFYYEVEYPLPGGLSQKRRFTLAAAPSWEPDRFQWVLRLVRQENERGRDGSER